MLLDGSPLCLPCADGEPCSFERVASVKRLTEDRLDVFDVIIPVAVVAQKPAAPASVEKSDTVVPKKARRPLFGKAWNKNPQQEKTVKQPKKPLEITEAIERQIIEDFKAGMTVNAVGNKYDITWFIADKYRAQAGVSSYSKFSPKPKPVAETPVTMKEVFDEVFAAKPESWVGRTTQEIRDSCRHMHTDNTRCFDCGIALPAPFNVPNPPPYMRYPPVITGPVPQEVQPMPLRISIAFDLSEEEAVAMFGNLSAIDKAVALRSVLSGLLRTS